MVWDPLFLKVHISCVVFKSVFYLTPQRIKWPWFYSVYKPGYNLAMEQTYIKPKKVAYLLAPFSQPHPCGEENIGYHDHLRI